MRYTWDLTDIYKNEEEFNSDFEALKKLIPNFANYQGKLNDENVLMAYLTSEREVERLLNKLYTYAASKADLDRRDIQANSIEAKVEASLRELISITSYADPELLSLGKAKIDEFLNKHPEFNDYSFIFTKLFNGEKHVLTPDKEKILSYYNGVSGVASNLYSTLSVSDYISNTVKLSNGDNLEVNVSNWTSLIEEASSAEDRKIIFGGLYKYFDLHKNTYAEIYSLGLQAQLANTKSRGYSSIVESHLESNQIPVSVYENLVEVASKNSAPLKEYYKIRAKALGLKHHRSYDRFLQLAKSNKNITYEEGLDLFYKSIERFPLDFQNKAREVSKEGRIDVYPSEGKRTGAYSNGGGGVKPHILLNFLGKLDDAFTIAHESGHSIHTLYSMETQPLLKQNYTIFVAEIASTFNEHNLLDYLLKQDNLSKEDKISLLQKSIDEIASTFYRQTLFAQYELEISKLVEENQPINYEVLSNKMAELYMTYYGIDIKEEIYKPLVWAYIPHLFYSPFYVYQYATSFAASLEIYSQVNSNVEGAFDRYISLLKSGGSDYPINEVKQAGVDLTTKEPFLAVVRRMEKLVKELKELLGY